MPLPQAHWFVRVWTGTFLLCAVLYAVTGGGAPGTSAQVACRQMHSGVVNVGFYNGRPHSTVAHVTLPAGCSNPSVVTLSQKDSVLCGNDSGPTNCPNDASTTSQDLHSYAVNVTSSGFDVFVSGNNGVWVGATSPAFPIAWQAACGGDASTPVCSGNLASGVANVNFTNGQAHTTSAPMNLPANCSNPSVVTQSLSDSILCGNGSGPITCPNDPSTTSTDLFSYRSGNNVFLSAMNGVWTNGNNPYRVAYHAACQNDIGGTEKTYAGIANVAFFNGHAHSTFAHVAIPENCISPTVVTQSYRDSVLCGNGSGPTACPNDPSTTSTDLFSYAIGVKSTGFDVMLSAMNGVWVGATSPAFPIAWHVTCKNPPPASSSRASSIPSSVASSARSSSIASSIPSSSIASSIASSSAASSVASQCPANTARVEYAMSTVNTGSYDTTTGNGPQVPAVTCRNTPPAGGSWTLTDSECLLDNAGVCHSETCLWSRPTANALAYTTTHRGGAAASDNVNCSAEPPSGFSTLKSRGCVIPSTTGGCLSDICLWEKASAHPTQVSLTHLGASAANREHVDCRTVSNAENVARECFLSTFENGQNKCLSDLCFLSNTVLCPQVPQCSDGLDNDGDGATDFSGGDFSCSDGNDNDETFPKAQCQDGVDNDGDGMSDRQDPGCHTDLNPNNDASYNPQDNDESHAASSVASSIMSSSVSSSVTSSMVSSSMASSVASSVTSSVASSIQSSSVSSVLPQCRDGIDNDGDGAIDYPSDFSCSNPDDNDETFPKAQCQDGVDNDGDGMSDRQDPGCHTDLNPNNDASYNPQDNDESHAASSVASSIMSSSVASSAQSSSASSIVPQCRDGIDNDNDGATDFPNDFSCSNPDDNDETNPKAQCQDGIDNDYDGLIDFPQDPGCTSRQDNDEFNAASSVASSVMSSIASSAVSSVPRTGCIDILKEAFDTQGNPFASTPQFVFTLDGANPVGNDSQGRARYINVPVGVHTVAENTPNGWQLLQVTPVNGQIQVIPGQCVTVAFKNRQFLQASSVSSVPVASSIPASSVASSIRSSSVASSVASSIMSSSMSSVPTVGCVDIIKEAFDPHGNPLGLIPQFAFTIDGGARVGNDSQGRARYLNVPAGIHTIAEETPPGWQLLQVTPANGQVHVFAGQCVTVAFKNQQFFPQASSVSSVPVASSIPASSVMSSSRASSVASSVQSSSASSRLILAPIQNVNVNANANTTVNSNINANSVNVVDVQQSGGGIQNAGVNASANTTVNSTINAGAVNNIGVTQAQVQQPQQTGGWNWSSWLMQILGLGMGTGGLLMKRWF